MELNRYYDNTKKREFESQALSATSELCAFVETKIYSACLVVKENIMRKLALQLQVPKGKLNPPTCTCLAHGAMFKLFN